MISPQHYAFFTSPSYHVAKTRLKDILSRESKVFKILEAIKGLGSRKYNLGMGGARLHKSIFISERKYVIDLLNKMCMFECNLVDTPMDPTTK